MRAAGLPFPRRRPGGTREKPLRELHRPRVEKFVTGDCASEDCDHEDDCPTTDMQVCRECWSIAEEVHGIYWAEGNGPKDVVMWPCATAAILDALPGGERADEGPCEDCGHLHTQTTPRAKEQPMSEQVDDGKPAGKHVRAPEDHKTSTNPNGSVRRCDRGAVHSPHEYQAEFGAYFNAYCPGNDGLDPIGGGSE